MKTAVLAHGFNVRDGGKGTVDKLKGCLSGLEFLEADYGWFGPISVLLYNDNIARMIKGMTPKGAIGIGHSNGCALLVKAAQYGAEFDTLILINPALISDIQFPDSIKKVIVFHNKGDLAVKAAKWFNWLIPGRAFLWGDMGNQGYQGNDSRVINIDTLTWARGHSSVFKSGNIGRLSSLIKETLSDRRVLPGG